MSKATTRGETAGLNPPAPPPPKEVILAELEEFDLQMLDYMARNDPDLEVRARARALRDERDPDRVKLRELVTNEEPDLQVLDFQACNDPDLEVRAWARALLDELDPDRTGVVQR